MGKQFRITKNQIKEEILKCGRDSSYFLKKYAKIVHPTKGEVPFQTYDYQDDLLKKFKTNRFNIILKARQLGISTIVAGHIAWFILFQKHKEVIVLATKQDKARNILRKVKMILNRLPAWLRIAKEITDNKNMIELSNGSRVSAESTAGDAGRSDALALLVVDECVLSETKIKIRNKVTKKIEEISIKEFYDDVNGTKEWKVCDWEVLTPTGWSSFSGIRKKIKKEYIRFVFDDNSDLKCSMYHKLKTLKGEFVYAKYLKEKDVLSTKHKIIKKEIYKEEVEVYDLLDVSNNNEYYTNKVVSSNCAHVDRMDEIWTSAYSTLSSGGSSIILSTPKGTGNFFHRFCVDAKSHNNDFLLTTLMWDVHPDRDEEWFKRETKNMTKREIGQELLCNFNASGATVIDPDDIERLNERVKDPIKELGLDRNYWVWEEFDETKRYLITCDVARGDGQDYSSVVVMDINNVNVVAEYKGKIERDLFVSFIQNVTDDYANPMLVIENNNIGITVAQDLLELGYQNLYFSKKGTHEYVDPIQAINDSTTIPGITTSVKTRPLMIAKLEEYIRNKALKTNSYRFVEEIKTFIWDNGKPQAQKGRNDDLVMAYAIACWVRDTALLKGEQEVKYKRSLLSNIIVSRKNLDTTLPEQHNYHLSGMRLEKEIEDQKKKRFRYGTPQIFIG